MDEDVWVIREASKADEAACACLLADRPGWSHDQAATTVSRWFDEPSNTPFVLVAESDADGTVIGYGRADRLDPRREGGEAPQGWYLTGLVIAPRARRRGVGSALTAERLARIDRVAHESWYFTNVANTASAALHARLGFTFVTHEFVIPGVTFDGGVGSLFRRASASDDDRAII